MQFDCSVTLVWLSCYFVFEFSCYVTSQSTIFQCYIWLHMCRWTEKVWSRFVHCIFRYYILLVQWPSLNAVWLSILHLSLTTSLSIIQWPYFVCCTSIWLTHLLYSRIFWLILISNSCLNISRLSEFETMIWIKWMLMSLMNFWLFNLSCLHIFLWKLIWPWFECHVTFII